MASGGVKFPINGGTYAPYGVVTDDNHGSYVVIGTWVFACISVLFVTVRVALRTWTSRRFGRDNALIVVALLFAIAQSICASESVRYGLGRHFDTLGEKEIHSYYRTIFASEILSVFVFVFVKLSMMVVISHINPSNTVDTISRWFTIFTALWGISYIFSVSFQCGARVPIRASESACISEGGLLYTHGAINILTDIFIVALPILVIWNVRMPRPQRLLVVGLFWGRIVVCVAAGMRLGTLEPYLSRRDFTWDYLKPTLWNQITIHLSIITACIPSIKPFFDALQSSLVDSGIPRNYKSKNLIELRPWKTSNKSSGDRSSQRRQSSLRGLGLTSTTQNEPEDDPAGDETSSKAEPSKVRRGPIMLNRSPRT